MYAVSAMHFFHSHHVASANIFNLSSTRGSRTEEEKKFSTTANRGRISNNRKLETEVGSLEQERRVESLKIIWGAQVAAYRRD